MESNGFLFVGQMKSILWAVLLPHNSHTMTSTFLLGDPYMPLFATITGKGDNPKYPQYLHCCFLHSGCFLRGGGV